MPERIAHIERSYWDVGVNYGSKQRVGIGGVQEGVSGFDKGRYALEQGERLLEKKKSKPGRPDSRSKKRVDKAFPAGSYFAEKMPRAGRIRQKRILEGGSPKQFKANRGMGFGMLKKRVLNWWKKGKTY